MGSPRARIGAITSSTRDRSPVKQTAIAQIFRPRHSSGTKGAGGAWRRTSHTLSSRGAPAVSVR